MSSQTVAVIFDFDDTLASDSTTSFLESIGIDSEFFWKEQEQRMSEGWDPVPSYLQMLVEYAKERPITKEMLVEFGKQIELYPGARGLFGRLREFVKSISPDINLEFYLLSSGIGDIIRNTPIAYEFTDIWANEFHYDEEDNINFPKRLVSFTEKTRFMYTISKGLVGEKYRSLPLEVNKRHHKFRIPFSQMIYVGDGFTDIPCFALLKQHGGFPLGVYDGNDLNKRAKAWQFIEERRVSALASTNYSRGSDLMNLLEMALKSITDNMK